MNLNYKEDAKQFSLKLLRDSKVLKLLDNTLKIQIH